MDGFVRELTFAKQLDATAGGSRGDRVPPGSVVLQKSIPAQIRQLIIIYNSSNQG